MIDVSHLPDYNISNESSLWWGQALMAAIEGSLFLMLVAMYFYLRLSVDVWPPPQTKPLDWIMPTAALLPFLLSCVGSYWASEGAKQNDSKKMLTGMIANVVLALIALGMRAVAWNSFNFSWNSDVHGSIVWTILFLHTFDAIADLIFTGALIVLVAIGRDDPRVRLGVHVDSVLWYFIVGIWLPLYVAVYWGPRLVGTHS
jgi:cytochrome c oxidase subunit I+III